MSEPIDSRRQPEVTMTPSAQQEIARLQPLTAAELRGKYQELFGESPRSRHKAYLVRRIAWRLQALAEGDLSQRARRRAAELACDADLRISAPAAPQRPGAAEPTTERSHRHLPPPGTVLARPYRGRTIEVTVLAQGFAYDGRVYRSLSAVAKAVTGKHWNGYHFFGLWTAAAKRTPA
jgi:hypothetical protein